eukprot:scaffold108915_cov60-Phaeocystis_antarctica.AAC.3
MRQLVAAGPHRLSKQWLPRWRSSNPLSRRAGSIEVPLHSLGPPRRAGVGHWDGAVRFVSVDPSAQKDHRGALHYQSELSRAHQPWTHPGAALGPARSANTIYLHTLYVLTLSVSTSALSRLRGLFYDFYVLDDRAVMVVRWWRSVRFNLSA